MDAVYTQSQVTKFIEILKNNHKIRFSKLGKVCLDDFVINIIESKNKKLYIRRISNKILLGDLYYIEVNTAIDLCKQGKSKTCKKIVADMEINDDDDTSIIDPKNNIFQCPAQRVMAINL